MPKITQYPQQSVMAADDQLLVVDTSTGTTKRVSLTDLINTVSGLIKPQSINQSVADQAARDAIASPFEGLTVFRRDTDAIEVYDGTAWLTYDTKYQTYTPDVYTNGVLWTKGNATVLGRYKRSGKSMEVIFSVTLGSTTTWGGAGAQEITMPANVDNTTWGTEIMFLSRIMVLNAGVNTGQAYAYKSASASRVALAWYQYGGSTYEPAAVTNTSPFTSAVGDKIAGHLIVPLA